MSSVIISGDTSGAITLAAPAVAGTNTITLPASTGTVITTASSGQSIPKAALPTGSVLQVVSVVNKAQTSTTGSAFIASTIAASITPTSATSKILIITQFYARTSAAGVSTAATIYRGATDLGTSTYGFSYIYGTSSALEVTIPISFLDSPATTSSTTYTVYFKRADSAGTAYVGSTAQDNVITLMEIAA